MDSPLKSQLAEAIQQRRYAQAQELYESLNQEALHSRFAKLQQLKFKQTQANSSIEQNLKQNLEDFHAHWAAVFSNKAFMEDFVPKFRPLVMTQEVKLLNPAPWGPHP